MTADRPFFEILREERPEVAEALSGFVNSLPATDIFRDTTREDAQTHVESGHAVEALTRGSQTLSETGVQRLLLFVA